LKRTGKTNPSLQIFPENRGPEISREEREVESFPNAFPPLRGFRVRISTQTSTPAHAKNANMNHSRTLSPAFAAFAPSRENIHPNLDPGSREAAKNAKIRYSQTLHLLWDLSHLIA